MKYHVPTEFGFSPKASGLYPFGDATDLAGEGGVGDVVWLIQASASNHKPKGRFFWFAFGIYKPKEPSLWFVVYVVLLEISHATDLDRCEALASAKGCVLYFCFDSTL